MPQIQCFGTTKMATVSARTPKLFTSMFNHHCLTGRICFHHVKRHRESPTRETKRIQKLFNHISIEAMDPTFRIVVFIEEDTFDKNTGGGKNRSIQR